MKNTLSYLIVLLLGVIAITFSSCEEKDDYNYDGIDPVVSDIMGAATVRGGTTVTYRAVGRAGSSYAFSYTGAIESTASKSDEVYALVVDFKEHTNLADTLDATISVVETTMGGKVSPAKTVALKVLPLNIALVGEEILSIQEGKVAEVVYTVDFYYPGATYAWTVDGTGFTVEEGTTSKDLKLTVDYPDDFFNEIDISVEVTTRGGNKLTDAMSITVWQFCPLEIEELYLVEWQGNAFTSGGVQIEADPILIKDPLDLPDDILNNPFITVGLPPAFAGKDNVVLIDGLASAFINDYWGEAWQDRGFSLAILNEPAGEIEIPLQFLGQSDYPDNYWIVGYGTYNYCVPSLTIHYAFGYDGPDADEDPDGVDMENDIAWIFGWNDDDGEPNWVTTELAVKDAKSYFKLNFYTPRNLK